MTKAAEFMSSIRFINLTYDLFRQLVVGQAPSAYNLPGAPRLGQMQMERHISSSKTYSFTLVSVNGQLPEIFQMGPIRYCAL